MRFFRKPPPKVYKIQAGEMFLIDRRAYRVYKTMLKELKVNNLRRRK